MSGELARSAARVTSVDVSWFAAATSADISFNVRPGTDLFSINLERGFDTVFGFDFWGKRPNVSCLTA